MTYTKIDGIHRLETPHGVFEAGTYEAAKLAALMAENDALRRQERRDELAQIARDEQRLALEFNDNRRGE